MAIIEIKCPLCKGSLWIDQSTGKVVDHREAGHKKSDLSSFLEQQKNKSGKWEEKMKNARDEELRKKAQWDENLKKARENPDEPDDLNSPFRWD